MLVILYLTPARGILSTQTQGNAIHSKSSIIHSNYSCSRIQGNECDQSVKSGMSIYDIPRTPTPEPAHQPRNNDECHDRLQRASDSTCIIQFKQKPGALSVTEAKNPTRVSQKHASTRKRRLPVNQLALLRTTMSDGLPHPNVRSCYMSQVHVVQG